MSATKTHQVPSAQFAFSDDTVLSESVGRMVDMRLYPNKIRCNLLGKTHRKRFTTSGHGKFIAHEMGVSVE
jgi:hypothetical protein